MRIIFAFLLVICVVPQQQQESPQSASFPRNLVHKHLESGPLFGNSTELQYFYTDLYVGSGMQKQSVIVDTGSGVIAFPCENHCEQCGKYHIDEFFDLDNSNSKYVYSCRLDTQCKCVLDEKCKFEQRYGEGSLYSGFLVRDQVYFGETIHPSDDGFDLTFGCATKETRLFYTQYANGILGLTRQTGVPYLEPIYDRLYNQGHIERRMFSLCLGKNGGFFQLGGYDSRNQIDSEIKWAPLIDQNSFIVHLNGISMNDHTIGSSKQYSRGFIDSGTTFSYFPTDLFKDFETHFDWFCQQDSKNHCKGKRLYEKDSKRICFDFNEENFKSGVKPYFASFPVLNFQIRTEDKQSVNLKWFASEYLYRYNENTYCFGAESDTRNEIMMGGTLMRQTNFIFDVEANKVGFARTRCNEDPNQILNEDELVQAGQTFGLTPDNSLGPNQACVHRGISSLQDDSTIIRDQGGSSGNSINQEKPYTSSPTSLSPIDYIFMAVILCGVLLLILICYFNSGDDDSKEEEGLPEGAQGRQQRIKNYRLQLEEMKRSSKRQKKKQGVQEMNIELPQLGASPDRSRGVRYQKTSTKASPRYELDPERHAEDGLEGSDSEYYYEEEARGEDEEQHS